MGLKGQSFSTGGLKDRFDYFMTLFYIKHQFYFILEYCYDLSLSLSLSLSLLFFVFVFLIYCYDLIQAHFTAHIAQTK